MSGVGTGDVAGRAGAEGATGAVGPVVEAYKQAVMALPAWEEWHAAALKEEWLLEEDEVDWPTVLRVNRSAGVPPAP